MGYKNNSPVKKIWIPLEYEWLGVNATGGNFLQFNEIYKEKYGIDLTEIVKLDDNRIVIEGDVSTYIIPDGVYTISYVDNSPLDAQGAWASGDSGAVSRLMVTDKGENIGFGIQFEISKSSALEYANITATFFEF